MNKPVSRSARPLSAFVAGCLGKTFAKQGFASAEIVTRWPEIVGPEIAAQSEPLKIQWPRGEAETGGGTLVLRVEGPAAIEVQHLSGVVIERVNRFFGWPAVARLALRQAPLRGRPAKAMPPPPDTAAALASLPESLDSDLRQALARLSAAIKRT